MADISHLLVTRRLKNITEIIFEKNASLVRADGSEPRQAVVFTGSVSMCLLTAQKDNEFSWKIDENEGLVKLRSAVQLDALVQRLGDAVYIDITGLDHHIWASLIRAAVKTNRLVRVIYIQPSEYSQTSAGIEGEIFDLSERVKGLASIPGFASLAESPQSQSCLVPLLGFEGRRFAYLVEQVQPGDRIFPIVGLPGFRVEYPFYTHYANSRTLDETKSWKHVRFAAADDPFGVYQRLKEIEHDYPGILLKIAPIGTKPHALGAFLFSLNAPRNVEFIYDFPIRKKNRTQGVGVVLVYYLSEFTSDWTSGPSGMLAKSEPLIGGTNGQGVMS